MAVSGTLMAVVFVYLFVIRVQSPDPPVASPDAIPTLVEPVPPPPDTFVLDGGTAEAPRPAESSAPPPTAFDGIAQLPTEPTPRTDPLSYAVESGDVLWQIAEHFGLRSETLLWANQLDDPDLLQVGQSLMIPPQDGVFYTLRPGDRLSEVAVRYGLDVDSIAAINHLSSVDQVQAGEDLFLPGARPSRPATALADVVAPTAAGAEQAVALIAPSSPLPANIEALLTAGWLQPDQATTLFRSESGGAVLHELPSGARLERLDGFNRGRIEVRDPGDGKSRQAMTGWVSALAVGVGRAPGSRELPQAYPADTAMGIAHVFAPYRSQLDGTAYAQANCGPTTIAMALAAFGVSMSSGQLRTEALNAQRIWGNNVGTLITALADVVGQHGVQALDLYGADGQLRRWSVDDVRSHVQRGQPVVVQVRYRSLPNRGTAPFFGDHYILITGLLGDGFLYNDAIDADGVGWDRVLTADRLQAAMAASDTGYARTAFALAG